MLGSRLKSIRESLKLNQKEFASKLSISQQVLSNYEKGQRDIPTDILLLLPQFDVNPSWLLTGQGDMFINQSQSKPQTVPQQTSPSQCPTCQELKAKIGQLEAENRELIRENGKLEGKCEHTQKLEDENKELRRENGILEGKLSFLQEDNHQNLNQNHQSLTG